MAFNKGAKVTCINNDRINPDVPVGLYRGSTYTVENVLVLDGIEYVEVLNANGVCMGRFLAHRFA